MSDQRVYYVSLRVLLFFLGGVVAMSALSGGGVAWMLTRSVLQHSEQTPRVIERVASSREDTLMRVAEDVHEGVIGLLDVRGAFLQTGLVLTADGLSATIAEAGRPLPTHALLPNGRVVPLAVVREYPEKGVMLFRIPGSFPAPRFIAQGDLRPGLQGIALRTRADSGTYAAALTALESLILPSPSKTHPGNEHVGTLKPTLGAEYAGAPFWGADGRLLGFVTSEEEGGILLPGFDIDQLLQDTLRHPGEASSREILMGLRGTWIDAREAERIQLPTKAAFAIDAFSSPSPLTASGLKTEDVIVGVNGTLFSEGGSLWEAFLEVTRSHKSLTLEVWRQGAKVSLTVQSPLVTPSPLPEAR